MLEKQIIINANRAETRIALVEKEHVAELFIERSSDRGLMGNIYKGKVTRVLPGMQSAFVDIGEERSGFLYVADVYNDEFVALSRKALEGSTEDLTPEEISKKTKWVRVPIEKLLRDGQEIIVQVIKEPFNTKGARLSMFITIPGRYLVLAPNFSHIGISKKIEDEDERNRLRDIVAPVKPDDMSVIVRTAAKGVEASLLERDLQYLTSLWSSIAAKQHGAKVPEILHQDLDLVQRVTRDQFSDEISKIVIDDNDGFDRLRRFLDAGIVGASDKLELYQGETPVFDVYGIEMDIGRALSRKIDLPSGGYVIVDQTEALTSFDVNTGRYVGRQSARETVLRTNMEAVKKVVSQLRLRNIGGIIVIDFIDMEDPVDREIVFNELTEELKQDKAKTNVLRISELGLVQMTRKRTSESLEHLLMDQCPLCEGRGRVKSVVTEAHDLLRELVRVHLQTRRTLLTVRVREDIRDWILEEERDWFQDVVDRYGLTVNFTESELTLSALNESSFEVTADS